MRLEAETDPIAIASQAGNQPTFPDLRRIGPDTAPTTPEYSYVAYETRADAQAFADASGDVQDQVEQQEAAVQPAVEAGAAGDAVAAGEAGAVDDGAVAPEGEAEPETLMVGVMDPDGGNPKVGVMDPDAGNRPVETPSISGADAGQGGVAVAAEATEGSTQGEQAQDQSEGAQEASEELVALAAEARVVMPRSSGAGSWLRWPNSSHGPLRPGPLDSRPPRLAPAAGRTDRPSRRLSRPTAGRRPYPVSAPDPTGAPPVEGYGYRSRGPGAAR